MARFGRRKAAVWGATAIIVAVAVGAAAAENLELAMGATAVLAGLASLLEFGAWDTARGASSRLARVERKQASGESLKREIEALSRHVSRTKEQLRWEITKDLREQTKQVEALLQVLPRSGDHPLLPPSGGFALDARALGELRDLIRRERPQFVVELGSGTSTVWIAQQLKQTGGRIVSIDHDSDYAEATRRQLALHSLTDVAEVRVAPLADRGEDAPWYDETALEGLAGIDLLLVDGPPEATGPFARRPALEVLRGALRPGAVVALDDIHRDTEQEILEGWTARWPEFRRVDAGVSTMAVLKDTTSG